MRECEGSQDIGGAAAARELVIRPRLPKVEAKSCQDFTPRESRCFQVYHIQNILPPIICSQKDSGVYVALKLGPEWDASEKRKKEKEEEEKKGGRAKEEEERKNKGKQKKSCLIWLSEPTASVLFVF